MDVIKHYKSCELNMAKTTPRIESYELGSVWTYLKKTNLNGAHNSLVDAKAQTDIVLSSEFMPYLEKKRSYRSISNIWSATEQSEMKKKLESIREHSYRTPCRSKLLNSYVDIFISKIIGIANLRPILYLIHCGKLDGPLIACQKIFAKLTTLGRM